MPTLPTHGLTALLISAAMIGCSTAKTDPPASPSAAPEAEAEADPGMDLDFAPADEQTVATVVNYVERGRQRIRAYFELPFLKRFTLHVLPSRAAFDAFFREEWGIDQTQCWWVAAGLADDLVLLSPRVWNTDACEHDPADEDHIKGIVAHELVHVFHAQRNPGLEELEEIGWFVEGLATFVSGQLDDGRMQRLRDALRSGAASLERLQDGWSGEHRYAISGSLVEFIEVEHGHAMVMRLLTASRESELLGLLGTTEAELLSSWRAFVLDGR